MTTKTITAFVDHPSEWNTTGTVTPLSIFTETASLLISQLISTIFVKKVAVRVTYAAESFYTIRKNTQIADFAAVTTEIFSLIEPIDTASLSMIPADLCRISYVNELLRANKPQQQNNTFLCPTPKNPGRSEDRTPIQSRIINELFEMKTRRPASTGIFFAQLQIF